MRIKGLIILSLITLLLVQPAILLTSSNGVGFHPDFPHARVVVTRVVDGDTVHISPPVCVAGEYRTVVRLADIDAPELDTPEGEEAQNALINLLAAYNNIVYLDIANYSREAGCSSGLVDNYGRIVAVLYVRVNRTYILNVNKWMVDNEYAVIQDFQDDFDPDKWSLYLEYSVESEKLPEVTRILLCENCNIAYNTTWGIRAGFSHDGEHLLVTYSLFGDWRLVYRMLASDGSIVRSGVVDGTSLHVGYSYIASNDTGFFVTYRDHTVGPHRARFVFIPYDPGIPVFGPADVFGGSWHGTPIAVWNPYNDTWVVVYGHQTTGLRPRTFINFVSPAGAPSGGVGPFWLSPFGGSNRTGYDVLGGLIIDHTTKRIAYVARNESPAHTYNIEIHVFPATKDEGVLLIGDVIRLYIDTDGRGPEPSMFNESFPASFTRFLLWPSIYTSLLGSGRYLLTVYNDTDKSLAYAIVDLGETKIVSNGTLIDLGVSTTFYPWIASNYSTWLVAWSAFGWVNLSLLDTSGVVRSFVLADGNASYVRVVFDDGSSKYIIPYAITDETGTRNLYVAFYDTSTDTLEPWVLPVSTVKGVHETPLHVAVLRANPGQPGRIAIVALEGVVGGNLVVYLVSESYHELQEPIPIPEPWYITVVVATAAAAFVTYSLIVKKRKH
ncbi:MAG: hypothetical protein QW579_06000 [Desulfurococcaceae archaeon]